MINIWTDAARSQWPDAMEVSFEYPGYLEICLKSGGLLIIGDSNGTWEAQYYPIPQSVGDGDNPEIVIDSGWATGDKSITAAEANAIIKEIGMRLHWHSRT